MKDMDPTPGKTVVIADDHPGMLRCVSELLGSRLNVVAAVGDGTSALEAITRLQPDIVVLDIMMPELNGISVACELQRRGSQSKIIFLTIQHDEDYVAAAFNAGARGYVLKSRMKSDLLVAIEHALSDRDFISEYPTLSK
jgi:DNA-binding NarL/FixJ family response regulator